MSYPHYRDDRACRDSLTPLLEAQHEWSQRTFGTAPRVEGVLDHIERELIEVRSKPADCEEWIDIALLAFDGALRQGHPPDRVVEVLFNKAFANRVRKWPPLSEQSPIRATEHVREVVS